MDEERRVVSLTDAQLRKLAKHTAEEVLKRATAQMFETVGRNAIERFFALVGIVVVAVLLWLDRNGSL